MLLAIDIGNTATTFGLFRKERLIRQWWMPTGQISVNLLRKGILKSERLSAIIISSVAPKALTQLKKKLIHYLGIKPLIVGQDITIKVLNLYHNPEQVVSFSSFWFHLLPFSLNRLQYRRTLLLCR